jgi:UDP-N-acetylglucosamine 2-epimerase (non-hydrolysing)
VVHVEAGLRTNQLYSPFPEEMNRRLTSKIAAHHFAPTENAKANLLAEGISESQIHVVGNTVIDSLEIILNKEKNNFKNNLKKNILITIHRSENRGENLKIICSAIKKIAEDFPEYHCIFPVHLNPLVRDVVFENLGSIDNISLVNPIPYDEFVNILSESLIVITDSGGIQEEVTWLGIPTLVLREFSERPEAFDNGSCVLVPNLSEIYNSFISILKDKDVFNTKAVKSNIFGDGTASKKIVNQLINK